MDNYHDFKILSEDYYLSKSTIELAQDLIGKYLIRELDNSLLVGQIIETEAYLFNDQASHSYKGITKGNSQLFGRPGTAYIYFTYGKHWCFNVVSNKEGVGEGVLIRALKPIYGIDKMIKNREHANLNNLTNGPAKITQAYQIDHKFNGHFLWKAPLYVSFNVTETNKLVNFLATPRIGIRNNKNALLRYTIREGDTK